VGTHKKPWKAKIPSHKVLRILKGFGGILSRSGKMLSTFEFWLELNRRCKGKNIAGRCQQTFCFQFNIKLIQSKTRFSVALLNGRKNSNFFTLPDLDKIPPRPFKILWTLIFWLHFFFTKFHNLIIFFLMKYYILKDY
jgi:hypothetical protein